MHNINNKDGILYGMNLFIFHDCKHYRRILVLALDGAVALTTVETVSVGSHVVTSTAAGALLTGAGDGTISLDLYK